MPEYWSQLYQFATGWLGWSDEQAMTTPVPRILIALDGKVDFVRKTNPFGAAEEPEPIEDAAVKESALMQWADTINHR